MRRTADVSEKREYAKEGILEVDVGVHASDVRDPSSLSLPPNGSGRPLPFLRKLRPNAFCLLDPGMGCQLNVIAQKLLTG